MPIPFSDLTSTKVRPAIVVGHGSSSGDLLVVPVTSRMAQGDFSLKQRKTCGLHVPSAVKGQLATIDSRLVRKVVGRLAKSDIQTLDGRLRTWLDLR
ncbi:MAG: type II toxin-antitoxin system PemK/MazF family toxin [Verrucomicrobia bacterium]|nr:type II toxin-antitoxin system PemK/MazF family toxin [Verrucomicrobiota bacterium]